MNAKLLRILLITAIVAGVMLAVLYRDHFDAQALAIWVEEAGAAAPLLFMLIYAVGTVLFLPGSVITLAGGALFGPVLGTFYKPYRRHHWRRTGLSGVALPGLELGGKPYWRASETTDQRCRGRGLAFRGLYATGATVPLQPPQLCPGPDPHPVPALCHHDLRLHVARRHCLHLPRLCGT